MIMHITVNYSSSRSAGIIVCLLAIGLLPLAPTLMSARQGTANAIVPPQPPAADLDVAGRPERAGEKLQPALADDPWSETVEVTVVDEAGQPVAGAAVRVLEDDRGDGRPVETDGAGACRIPRPLGVTPLYSLSALFLAAADGGGARAGLPGNEPRGPRRIQKAIANYLKTSARHRGSSHRLDRGRCRRRVGGM